MTYFQYLVVKMLKIWISTWFYENKRIEATRIVRSVLTITWIAVWTVPKDLENEVIEPKN